MEDIHVKVQSEYLQFLPDSEDYGSSSSNQSIEESSEDCSWNPSQFIKKSVMSNRFALQRYFSSLALFITKPSSV